MTNQAPNSYTELPNQSFSITNDQLHNDESQHIKASLESPPSSSPSSPPPSSSPTSSSNMPSSMTSMQKLSNLLNFPLPSTSSNSSLASTISSIFSSPPSGILNNAIISTTTLLTFPISMDLDLQDQSSEVRKSDESYEVSRENNLLNIYDENVEENTSVPICLISSPSPPLNEVPIFPASSTLVQASSTSLSSSSTLSSSSSPSLTSLLPNNTSPSSSPPKHNFNSSLSPPSPPSLPKDGGFVQRKMPQGKKLSVSINPAMNRLMDGCHTVGVIGPSRDKHPTGHKRESILHKSDLFMKDMSPSIRSSLGSFNDGVQDEAIITPYAQLLNSLRGIRNNYFIVANLSPMRSRRLSGYESQKILKQSQLTDEMKQKLAIETLEEIEFCLDKLETMQTHPSAAHMAAHKFRQILNREMSQNPDLKTGGSISGYLRSFLEESGNEDEPQNKSNNKGEDQTKPVTPPGVINNSNLENGNISDDSTGDQKEQRKGGDAKMNLESFMSDVSPQLDEMIKSTWDTWGVDLFELATLSNNRPLTYVALHLFQKRNLLHTLRIHASTFFRYMSEIERNYHSDNPYHNNIHATDVLQATHSMLNFSVFKDVFSDMEVFAAMFAAAVHDVDHPGVTNHFLISTGSELAVLYNDESVLENHHATLAFQILNKKGCDALTSFSRKQKQLFRKMVISMVLATDMSKHLQHVAHLKTMVEVKRLSSSSSSSCSNISSIAPSKVIDPENYEDKIQILQTMVHCSDLSNPLKPLEVYLKWTDRIMEEFFRQGDREKVLGLEVSPLCDRDNSSICKSQIGFIDYVVHPLWETWGVFTQPDCQNILDYLENNRVWLSTQDLLASNKTNSVDDEDDDVVHDNNHA